MVHVTGRKTIPWAFISTGNRTCGTICDASPGHAGCPLSVSFLLQCQAGWRTPLRVSRWDSVNTRQASPTLVGASVANSPTTALHLGKNLGGGGSRRLQNKAHPHNQCSENSVFSCLGWEWIAEQRKAPFGSCPMKPCHWGINQVLISSDSSS